MHSNTIFRAKRFDHDRLAIAAQEKKVESFEQELEDERCELERMIRAHRNPQTLPKSHEYFHVQDQLDQIASGFKEKEWAKL